MVFDNVKYGQTRVDSDANLPLTVSAARRNRSSSQNTRQTLLSTLRRPVAALQRPVEFVAEPAPNARYTWLFGDGTEALQVACAIAMPMRSAPSLTGRRWPLSSSAAC